MKPLILSALALTLTGCSLITGDNATVQNPALKQQILADMVFVEGGTFSRGDVDCDSELKQPSNACPSKPISVDDFSIGRYEVTQQLFEQVMGTSSSYFPGDNYPVNNVSWQQAQFFITQLRQQTGLAVRLPTEAEWEYAANGGLKSQGYQYSGSDNIDDVAWHAGNAGNKAHPIGQKMPNELGLYDMTGNVGEMVIDAYLVDYYYDAASDNPVNARDDSHHLSFKVVRGGSFAYDETESKNYTRDSASQSALMSDIGLRLVISDLHQ
ncbi:Formylglycine-generating enzyme [Sinobacterium norvegicum]|uniref:Formylglycine-generating enzyme n=1 Tax=Sinobacterium norvegicum TaxID=1641715 RepID=A0ABM9AHN6_9GAMM|nr:SUMF1/EgtB/PvdO family nonheme iron enzyme [Sinobacterium norvegicum]CAH0992557.1 Formylglycine-generating enzyme [Sinobacterium norvegicum]